MRRIAAPRATLATVDEGQGRIARTPTDVGLQLLPVRVGHDLSCVRWAHVVNRLGYQRPSSVLVHNDVCPHGVATILSIAEAPLGGGAGAVAVHLCREVGKPTMARVSRHIY